MRKQKTILLSLLMTFTVHLMAQEYSNDVTFVKGGKDVIVVTASGMAEKKKDVYDMALKSIFNAIFINGLDGVENGKALLAKEDSYYTDQFFSSRYVLFVKDYNKIGEPTRLPSKLYKGTVTAQILLGALKKDLVRNKLMEKPKEEKSIEEKLQEAPLPTIMVVPYKRNDNESYASILRNDFDLRMAVSTVKAGFIKLGVKTISAEGKTSGALRASEWENDNADSNDKQLLMNSGADVCVIVDLKKDLSETQGSRVALIMTAQDMATREDLTSRSGWTNRFRTTDLDKLCAYAAQDVLGGFLKDITKELVGKTQKGNTFVLRVSLAQSSTNTLNNKVDGNMTISSCIRDWVRKNAQGGRYHIQGSTDDYLVFDLIQVPAKDSNGNSMDAMMFTDKLVNFLNGLEIECESKVDGNTIYLTIL